MIASVEVDVEEVLDSLSYKDRADILAKYVDDISDYDLIEELESRGYKCAQE